MPPRALTPALAVASAIAVTPTRTGIPVAAGTTAAVTGRNAATLTNYNYYSYLVHGHASKIWVARNGREEINSYSVPLLNKKDRRTLDECSNSSSLEA